MFNHLDFKKGNYYDLYSNYMRYLCISMGYKIKHVTNHIFDVGNVRFNRTTYARPEVWKLIGEKTYIRQFLADNMPRLITKPEPNMIVKPIRGSLGKGIIKGDLLPIPDGYIAEKYHDGIIYRVIVVNGNVICALTNTKPYVIGDGISTVKQLIDGYERHIFQLSVPQLAKEYFNLLDYVPKLAEIVETHYLTNNSYGGIVKDCTENLPPMVEKLALKAFSFIPDLKVCGIDIVVDKFTFVPYLLEMNSAPGVYYHYFPMEGKKRDVLKTIVHTALSI